MILTFHFCILLTDACEHGDVTLVGGQSKNQGRVEVCVNGTWGTVSYYLWSTVDGQVVCKQLGYNSSIGNKYIIIICVYCFRIIH